MVRPAFPFRRACYFYSLEDLFGPFAALRRARRLRRLAAVAAVALLAAALWLPSPGAWLCVLSAAVMAVCAERLDPRRQPTAALLARTLGDHTLASIDRQVWSTSSSPARGTLATLAADALDAANSVGDIRRARDDDVAATLATLGGHILAAHALLAAGDASAAAVEVQSAQSVLWSLDALVSTAVSARLAAARG